MQLERVTLKCDPNPLHHPVAYRDRCQYRDKTIPLSKILESLFTEDFKEDLDKFAIIGFKRKGRHSPNMKDAYERRQVYSAGIFNLK